MHWIIIFLLAKFWTAVYSQTWIGTYNITSTCDLKTCCCMRHQILITRSSPNFLGINVTLEGYCLGAPSYYTNLADPNSYTLMTQISILTVTFQLSSDSSTITMNNTIDSSCDEVAVRQAAIVETTTVQTTKVQTTTVQTTIIQTTTVQTTSVQTTTVQTTIIQTATVPTTTISSTTVPSTTVPSTTVPTTTVPTTTISSTTIPTTTVPSTTVPSTTVPTTTVATTTIQTTTGQTTTVHSNAVPQYVNIIMLCSLAFFPIVMSF